jgi:hypothetical protein
MKASKWIVVVGVICLAGSVGCKKEQSAAQQESYGLSVDWRKLDGAFAGTTDPAVQAGAAEAKRALAYRQFPQGMAALERLAQNANLTPPQKKLVSDLMEQVKQVVSKGAAPGQ